MDDEDPYNIMMIMTISTTTRLELVGNPGGNKQRLRLEGIPTNREIWHHRQKPPLEINQINKYGSKQMKYGTTARSKPLKINQIKEYGSKQKKMEHLQPSQVPNRHQSQSNDHFITQRTSYYS